MGRFIGITGTPGTGKKSIAPLVAELLDVRCVSLNDLVDRAELARNAGGVNVSRLRRRLIATTRGKTLVFGHLLPEVLRRGETDRVVVLRCDPAVLRRRLESRGYPRVKLVSNVEAELIGLLSASCISVFGPRRVAEFDTTSKSVSSSAKSVAGILKHRTAGRPIEWLKPYSSAEKLGSLFSEARTDSAFT